MPANTVLIHSLIDRYREMVGKLYHEPEENAIIVGNFSEEQTFHPAARKTKAEERKTSDVHKSHDIRTLFAKSEAKETTVRIHHEIQEVTELD